MLALKDYLSEELGDGIVGTKDVIMYVKDQAALDSVIETLDAQGMRYEQKDNGINVFGYGKDGKSYAYRVSIADYLTRDLDFTYTPVISRDTTGWSQERIDREMAIEESFNRIKTYYPGISDSIAYNGAMAMQFLAQSMGKSAKDILDGGMIMFHMASDDEVSQKRLNMKMGANNIIRGWQETKTEDGKTVYHISLTKDADERTLAHEIGHVIRKSATAEQLSGFIGLEGYIGEAGAMWSTDIREVDGKFYLGSQEFDTFIDAMNSIRSNEEKFVDDFLHYVETGEAPNEKLKGLFERMKDFIRQIMSNLKGEISAEAKAAFDKFFTTDRTSDTTGSDEGTLMDSWREHDRHISERVQDDWDAVEAMIRQNPEKYYDSEGNLLAPNGEKSNLTYDQYIAVRTPAFKAWFGDWENDPESASKIVDDNGEPLVVSHGSFEIFETFEKGDIGYHFGSRYVAADRMSQLLNDTYWYKTEDDVKFYDCFLNIRNPLTGISDPGSWTGDNYVLLRELVRKGVLSNDEYLSMDDMYNTDELLNTSGDSANLNSALKDILKTKSYDGIVYENEYEGVSPKAFLKDSYQPSFIAFSSKQIKSATDNNGEYSRENDNTLFETSNSEQTLDYVDISDAFNLTESGEITEEDVKNYIEGLIDKVYETLSKPLQIKISRGNKKHVLRSNIKQKGVQKTSHLASLSEIERIVEGAKKTDRDGTVDLSHNTNEKTLKHKAKVERYVYFETPIKIGEKYFSVELVTERLKGQDPDILNLYNVRVKKNDLAAISLNETLQTKVTNNVTDADNIVNGSFRENPNKADNAIEDTLFDADTQTLENEYNNTLFEIGWHGSGVAFDNFMDEFIGTGEGQQAFGYGHYIAGAPLIGKGYADASGAKFSVQRKKDLIAMREREVGDALSSIAYDEQRIRDLNDTSSDEYKKLQAHYDRLAKHHPGMLKGRTFEQYMEYTIHQLERSIAMDKTSLELARRDLEKYPGMPTTKSTLYRVEIPDDGYLDWDKTPSMEDFRKISKALQQRLDDDLNGENISDYGFGKRPESSLGQYYGSIAVALGSDREATRFLLGLGYRGIVYDAAQAIPANMAPEGAIGARNHVMFDPRDIKKQKMWQYDGEEDYKAQAGEGGILFDVDEALDFFRNGGTIDYDDTGRDSQSTSDSNNQRASDTTGLRGLIEFNLSDRGNNGRLLQWRSDASENGTGSVRKSERSYIGRSDISGAGRVWSRRNSLLRRINQLKNSNYTGVVFYELQKTTASLNKFIKALNYTRENNPTGIFVSPKTLKELKSDNVRTFISGDGNTGYAIEYDHNGTKGLNNLVAVFNTNMNGETTRGSVYSILADAIEHGANVLDCYDDPKLLHSYMQMGFVPTGSVKFTDAYLSDEEKAIYKKNDLGKPSVIAMYYADRDINDTVSKISSRDEGYEKFMKSKTSKYRSDGYDLALNERDVIAREHLFQNADWYRDDPNNYRVGTRVGGAIGANPNPISEATGHGLQNWENIPGRAELADKISASIMGEDGLLSGPIPVRRKKGESSIKYLNRVAKYGADNVKFIFDNLSTELKELQSKWYDTAHAFAVQMRRMYDVSIGQSAAIISVLSPNYEWNNNLELADIVLDILVNAGDSYPSHSMIQELKAMDDRNEASNAKKGKGYTRKWTNEKVLAFASQKLNQMNNDDATDFIYAAIQSGEIDKSYQAGLSIGVGLTGRSSAKFGLTIGSSEGISKAISVYRDGSIENISENIGKEAKVRSFYNNILVPGSDRGEITADTWAMRDVFLGMDAKYSENMRNILFAGASGAGTGLTAVINEAFRIATDQINKESAVKYLPQQIQSITWTGIKNAWDGANEKGNSDIRESLNSAWKGKDVNGIRSIFGDLLTRYQPKVEDSVPVEGVPLHRRGDNSTIFTGSEARYNNLPADIAESSNATSMSASQYSENGGRKSLDGILFDSESQEIEQLDNRKRDLITPYGNDIKKALELGEYISDEYLRYFSDQDWAANELAVRTMLEQNPDIFDDATSYSSLEKWLQGSDSFKDTEISDEQRKTLSAAFEAAHRHSPEQLDRIFADEWTISDEKMLELAGKLSDPKTVKKMGGFSFFKGMSTKVLNLKTNDVQTGNGKTVKRSTHAQIEQAKRMVQDNPRAYRLALEKIEGKDKTSERIKGSNVISNLNEKLNRFFGSINAQIAAIRSRQSASGEAAVATEAENDATIQRADEDLAELEKEGEVNEADVRTKLDDMNEKYEAQKAVLDSIREQVSRLEAKDNADQERVTAARNRAQKAEKRLEELRKERDKYKNALNALQRRNRAQAEKEQRVKTIKKILKTVKYNTNTIDASFEDLFAWVRGLFDKIDREELYDTRSELLSEISARKAAGESTDDLETQLEEVRQKIKASEMVEIPGAARVYFNDMMLQKADNRQSAWTVEELEYLLQRVTLMRQDAKAMLDRKFQQRSQERSDMANGFFEENYGRQPVGFIREDVRNFPSKDDNTSELGKTLGLFFKIANATPGRAARFVDGQKEGVAYDLFRRKAWNAGNEEQSAVIRRVEAGVAKFKELGLSAAKLNRKGYTVKKANGDTVDLTRDEMIGVYIYTKSDLGAEKVMSTIGNGISRETCIDIIRNLSAEERAWGDFLLQEMGGNYSRIADVFYSEYNQILGRRDHYFPFVASGKNMEGEGDILAGPTQQKVRYTDKGFTKSVNPHAIYALQLNVTQTWLNQVKRQEHFIAFAKWTRDANYLLGRGGMGDVIRQKYGQSYLDNLQDYVNFVGSPQSQMDSIDRVFSTLMGSYGASKVIGNLGAMLKQLPTIAAAIQGDVDVKNFFKSVIAPKVSLNNFLRANAMLDPNSPGYRNFRQFIYDNDANMKNRRLGSYVMGGLNDVGMSEFGTAKDKMNSFIGKHMCCR